MFKSWESFILGYFLKSFFITGVMGVMNEDTLAANVKNIDKHHKK